MCRERQRETTLREKEEKRLKMHEEKGAKVEQRVGTEEEGESEKGVGRERGRKAVIKAS